MKKNMILLVIDSVFYDKILENSYRKSPMPFLNSLQKKGINATHMFSEAPYTEAALISLLCGIDTLKKGGYIKKMKGKLTLMEVFQQNGYTTFFNGFQPHVYPGKSYPGIDEKFYNVCFDFDSLWSYRFEYYSDLYKSDKLEEEYMPFLNDMLKDNLVEWIKCFKHIKNKDKEMSFIIDYLEAEDIDLELTKLEKEYAIYQKNELIYLKNLLLQGKNHNLFKIKTYKLNRNNSLEFRTELYNNKGWIIKKVYKKNMIKNLLNNPLIIKNPFTNKHNFIQYIKMYKNAVFDKDLMEKIDPNNIHIKGAPSMYSHINHFIEWSKEYKKEKPFFAYLHVDDCHYPEVFYSYDNSDKKKLDDEFEDINNFISNLPKKYKGSLAYDISLQYIDNCIKYLFDYLKNNNLLEGTNIAICADHGCSYTFDPMHESYVRNEYRENYNMPFILVGSNIKHKELNNFYNTKDIPATILDSCNIKIPKEFEGESLLKFKGRDYALLENVNGGCPDYNKRDVMLGIRTKKYVITISVNIKKNFKDAKIVSIFDIEKDKKEHHNLKNKINKKAIEKEFIILEKEFNELKKEIEINNFIMEK